ncbi:MAG: hypothetical protein Q9212_006910 [Teloschistes hypoglaucus]
MDKKLDGLVQSVEQKKQAVSSRSQELEALDAKLKETEERLKQKQLDPIGKRESYPGDEQQPPSASHAIPHQGSAFDRSTDSTARPAPSASTMSFWRPPMPGAMPETPGDVQQESYLGNEKNA